MSVPSEGGSGDLLGSGRLREGGSPTEFSVGSPEFVGNAGARTGEEAGLATPVGRTIWGSGVVGPASEG